MQPHTAFTFLCIYGGVSPLQRGTHPSLPDWLSVGEPDKQVWIVSQTEQNVLKLFNLEAAMEVYSWDPHSINKVAFQHAFNNTSRPIEVAPETVNCVFEMFAQDGVVPIKAFVNTLRSSWLEDEDIEATLMRMARLNSDDEEKRAELSVGPHSTEAVKSGSPCDDVFGSADIPPPPPGPPPPLDEAHFPAAERGVYPSDAVDSADATARRSQSYVDGVDYDSFVLDEMPNRNQPFHFARRHARSSSWAGPAPSVQAELNNPFSSFAPSVHTRSPDRPSQYDFDYTAPTVASEFSSHMSPSAMRSPPRGGRFGAPQWNPRYERPATPDLPQHNEPFNVLERARSMRIPDAHRRPDLPDDFSQVYDMSMRTPENPRRQSHQRRDERPAMRRRQDPTPPKTPTTLRMVVPPPRQSPERRQRHREANSVVGSSNAQRSAPRRIVKRPRGPPRRSSLPTPVNVGDGSNVMNSASNSENANYSQYQKGNGNAFRS